MSTMTDPPSDERKTANAGKRARGLGRKLVNRHTLIAALQIVYWTVRIIKAVRQMFGDL
ncbi:hypothetical protein [Shinella sp.]|uniref:hypothetical protein n=1 Tax=Shinella sp. TaxID=1870904 RepID=UPI0039E6824D